MYDYIALDQMDLYTWQDLKRNLKENKDKQKEMRKGLYCMWFPDNKEATTIAKISLQLIDLECDKIVQSVTLNNSVDKELSIRNAFEKLHNKASQWRVKFDQEYIDLKIEQVRLQYDFLWACHRAKEIEQIQREVIKEQKKEEQQLKKDKEKAERELSQLQYEYARRIQLKREKEGTEALHKQIEDCQRKLNQLDYSLAHVRAGFVYVVSNDAYSDERYKVGITRRKVQDRMKELANAAIPFEMNVNGYVFCEDVFDVETKVHNYLDEYRVNKVNKQREWFACSLDKIKEAFFNTCGIKIELQEVHNSDYLYSKGER